MSSPGQLHQEFTARDSLSQASKWFEGSDFWNNKPFGHLAPYYSTSHMQSGSGLIAGANLSALASFFEVTPPWAEYWENLDPTALESAINKLSSPESKQAVLSLRGPYSQIPSHRVAGKINLNTISEENVWRALEWNTLEVASRDNSGGPLNFWQSFRTSLDGQVGFSPTSTGIDPFGASSSSADWSVKGWAKPGLNFDFPTRFAGVYKESPAQSFLAPTTHLQRNPVDATLLRSDRSGGGQVPLFIRNSTRSSFDQNKHAIAHYQDTSRLANLTTANSNVFAVWITLGYFEWNEENGLLQEHKASSCENERYRSFFIIDRSIPVAYRPGEDWNVDNVVLIRRYLD